MKNNHVTITILDPERWYLKYTNRTKHYVQLHNSFWGDSDFLMLSNDEKVMFLWILSQSLRFNKATVSICLDFSYTLLSIPLDDSKVILSNLKKNNFIELDRNVRRQLKEENKRKEKKSKTEKKASANAQASHTPLIDEILDCWNRNAPDHNLPVVKKLNATRVKKLQTALKDFDKPDDWLKIFSVASTKGFTGKDGREFIPNWDYVFRNNNWVSFYDEYDVLFKPKSDEALQDQIEQQLINSLM
jgi:hypothetical protein